MASAPPIVSKPYTAPVGTNQKPLFFYTSTLVKQDSQGKVIGGETTLFYSPTPNNYIPSAKTSDGGKTWNYLKDSNGKFILGDDARRSLQEGVLKTETNKFIGSAAKDSGVPESQSKNLQLNQNTASSNANTPGENQGGNVSASEFSADQISTSIKDKSGGVRQDYGDDNRYPLGAKFGDQDCIKFVMYRYEPSKFAVGSAGLGGFSSETQNKGKKLGTVTLPVQPQISDSNSVSWTDDSMNSLQAAAAAAAYAGITKGVKGLEDQTETIAEAVRSQKGDITAALAAGFAGMAVGTNSNFLSRTTGAILNNNVALLFQGPLLRSFTFSFKMSAREKAETEMIRKIIRFFKQGMSVKRTEGNLFLKAPNIFEIQYLHKGSENKYINKIKTCALQNCVVNYTPEGNYATYVDGSMTSYDIQLTFSEIEPLYDDNYGQSDDGIIGY